MSDLIGSCPGCGVTAFRKGTPKADRPDGARQLGAKGLCGACMRKIPARERTGTFGAFQLHPSHLRTGTAMYVAGEDLSIPQLSDETRRAASLVVCAHAVNAVEARDFLEVLGLTGPSPAPSAAAA